MFGFFKKTKDEKPKPKKEENGEEEKPSTSKRDSLGRSKRLTLEMPKTPESPGKKSKKELKKSESVEPKSPKKLKTPESPGQKLKNKVLGSPLLRYRKEQKASGVSFDDISESSVTDSSRSDDLKSNTGILDKNAPKLGCRQIDDQQMLASLDTDEKQSAGETPGVFPKENFAGGNAKPPESVLALSHPKAATTGLENSVDTAASTKSRIKSPTETANGKEEGTNETRSTKPVQNPINKATANAPTSSDLAVITSSGIVTPVVTAESPSPEKVTQNPSPVTSGALHECNKQINKD